MQETIHYTVLDGASEAGAGKAIDTEDFRHVVMSVATSGSADMTVQFQGAISEDAPDFSSAAGENNAWSYIQVVDLEDGSVIQGDDGITFSAADDSYLIEFQTNRLDWVTANITSHTAGSVTVKTLNSTN